MKTNPPSFWIANALWILMALAAQGQNVQLLKDINTDGAVPSTLADEMVAVGNRLYISTDDEVVGGELWSVNTANFTGTTSATTNPNVVTNVSSFTGLAVGMNLSGTGIAPGTTITALNSGLGTLTLSSNATASGSLVALAATAEPTLLKDIVSGPSDSHPKNLTAVTVSSANYLYFTAVNPEGRRDLWRTDGTPANTLQVGSSNFGIGEGPERLTHLNGTLFYEGDNIQAFQGRELWKATGAATVRTEIVRDINPDFNAGAALSRLVPYNNRIYFRANDASNGEELWTSDGTSNGTTLFADLQPGAGSSSPRNVTVFNGFLYFTASAILDPPEGDVGEELFRASATPGSHTIIEDLEPGTASSSPGQLVVSGNRLFFTAFTSSTERELFTSDGSLDPENTGLVKDISVGPTPSGIANLTAIKVGTAANSDRVVFTADSGEGFGTELWISDGFDLGETKLLAELTPGPDGSLLANFIRVSTSLVIFTKEDSNGKLTLWKTDGTAGGTTQIEDFDAVEAADAVNLRNYSLVGTTLYFMLGEDELWKTNGRDDQGTVRVHRFRSATSSSLARDFTRLSDNRVVFSAVRPGEGREVWITDGTAVGTSLVADLFPGSEGSDPQQFTATNDGRFFFSAAASSSAGNPNRELYVSDGTTVSLVRTLRGSPSPTEQEINPLGSANPDQLAWINGFLYFQAADDDQSSNTEMWRTDGTAAGTVLLHEVGPGSSASMVEHFVGYKNEVYFTAAAPTVNVELFKSSGVAGSAPTLVKDINFGGGSSDPEEFVVMPNNLNQPTLYFVATGVGSGLQASQNTGREVWKSDGTSAGTTVLRDIVTGIGSSIDPSLPAYLTVVGRSLFFVADDGVNGRELWRYDGITNATTLVKNIATAAGTITGTNLGSNPTQLCHANGKLFFLADDGVNGRELWVSNGTSAGTVMVKNLIAGNGSPNIQDLTVVDDVVIFTADDSASGRELWISDGTAAGTRIATDLVVGPTSSNPGSLFGIAGNALFAAADQVVGNEPRSLALASRLVVEHPANTSLSNGATINFTPVNPVVFGPANASASQTLTLRNVGINNLRNVTVSISGINASEFTLTTRPTAIIGGATPTNPAGTASSMIVRFTPREGGTRSAVLTITSTDPLTPSFVLQLTGVCSKDPTITMQPVSRLVNVGMPIGFSSAASSATNLTTQWRRNAGAIAGAISSPYLIFSAQIAQAGTYSVQFKNSATPAVTATSNNAELGVVEDFFPARIQPVRLGTSTTATTITFNAAGNGLSYQWKRSKSSFLNFDAETLVDTTTLNPTKFRNTKTRTLTITGYTEADSMYYYCEVSGPGGGIIGGTTLLQVFSLPPQVATAQSMPDGIVSRFYSHQIVLADSSLERTPLTYAATNLPPGLTVNAKTGLISGRPTRAGTYSRIKVSATNGVTPNQLAIPDQTVRIVDMPTGLDGVYAGLIGREANLNDNLGGRIDLTVTALTGAFSGTLTMGTQRWPFRGGLDIELSHGAQPTDPPVPVPPYSATVLVPRSGILAPITLTFTLDPTFKNRFTVGQVTSQDVSGVVSAPVTAWKQVWKASPAASTAAAYQGLYNFGIRLPEMVNLQANTNLTNLAVPQGNGYGSFTVAAAGTLTVAGRTPDGESLTGGSFVGPEGEVLIYQTLYTTVRKGSIRGILRLDPNHLVPPAVNHTDDNLLSSDVLDWVRPPNPAVVSAAATTRTYRAGFGLPGTPVANPIELEAFGGRYVVPPFLLKITAPPLPTPVPSVTNASLLFTKGGLDANFPSGPAPSRDPNVNVAVTTTHTAVVVSANPALTRLTPTRTTGALTGSFTLSDTNLRTVAPLTPLLVPRAVTFQGLIVPEGGGATHRGVGYFILPQMPTADNATLVTTTPILSGGVEFKTN